MKFNLKNHPKFDINPKKNRELLLWFEGFEAELREIYEYQKKIYRCPTIAIKEILGE